MARIICIGSTSKDIFFPTSDGIILDTPEDLTSQRKIAFELGAKYHIDDRFEALGGCAANVAGGLARLGLGASCYTTIGDDLAGEWIKNEFKKVGVDTSYLRRENDCQSDLSAIVVDKESGERVIFSNQKANAKLEFIPEKIENPEWIFIGDLSGKWKENLAKIIEFAAKNKVHLAFNPRQKTIHDNVGKVIEAVHSCDLLLLNKDESIEIVSSLGKGFSTDQLNDEVTLIRTLKELGPRIVALTDGARGAWSYGGDKIFQAEAIVTEPLETTGAGDAFSSGFLAATIKGKDLNESLRWGIANGGSSVKFYGAHGGLLNEAEMSEKIKEIKARAIGL
ncbi:MAG: carbohydrate kinase family protein [Candidatus Moranbacteria bacterium]|nr:carbohydrate kinase family protein [Candidatus Moranbacteria bacterium]